MKLDDFNKRIKIALYLIKVAVFFETPCGLLWSY